LKKTQNLNFIDNLGREIDLSPLEEMAPISSATKLYLEAAPEEPQVGGGEKERGD